MQIQKTKGSCYILGSCVLYSLMACMVKTIADVSVFQITCMRFIVGLLILCTLAVTGVIRLQFVSWRLLFLRGFLGSIGVFATYLAVVKIGVSKGMVIHLFIPGLGQSLWRIFPERTPPMDQFRRT